jgi:HEAT repeat protein
MHPLRPLAIVSAFLFILASIPPSLFSQPAPKPSQSKQPAPPKRQTKRPQRADALAAAINELLKHRPLPPEWADEKAPEGIASEDENKPPADDAPIKEMIAYWSRQDGPGAQPPKPSDKVRQRLLEACEDRPEYLPNLLGYLPENTDTHDRLYKLLNEEPEIVETWKHYVRSWLQRNSAYFRDDLIKAARATNNNDLGGLNNEDLRALAQLDWNAAKPVLETLASAGNADVTSFALTLLYEHAAQEGDSARAESYRAILKATVENRQASSPARLISLTGLMDAEWSGQEEWFVSLFADPTLGGVQEDKIEGASESKGESSVKTDSTKGAIVTEGVTPTSVFIQALLPPILQIVPLGNTDRWLPVISNLVSHNNRTVHRAAVKRLVKFLIDVSSDEKKKKEIAQSLSPWMTEPNWATMDDRAEFIRSLAGLNMPELAPGLIWILDHDEDPDNRAAAAGALTKYRDSRAIPGLRRALENEEVEHNREKIVTALVECGGLSDDEMAAAVEAYARIMVTEEGADEIQRAKFSDAADKPLPLELSIGSILDYNETIQPTEGLALRLFERAKALRATKPAVARKILRIIEAAPLRVAEVNLVERIGEGWADFDSVALALKTRDALRKSAGAELYGLIKQGGYAAGVAAAILNDEREWKATLESRDGKAQLAFLACARYLRDKLPVELAGRLLNSPNRPLAKAAESYLEVEDSPEARKLVLARHSGEAYILGDIMAISNLEINIETTRNREDALRKEIRGRSDLEAIYAVAWPGGPAEHFAGIIIRVRGGKAELNVHETEGRRNVRWLTEGEFAELKSLTSRPDIEDLGPESYLRESAPGWKHEYFRLTKEGGRRIELDGLRRAPKNPTPHEELSDILYRLSRSGQFTARYDIEDKIPGVEVVFAEMKHPVLKVCAEGGEIRALIEEKSAEYMDGVVKGEPEWREFSSGKPGDARGEPSACRALNPPSSAPKGAMVINQNPFGQPAQSDGALFYFIGGEKLGIWKADTGMEPVKIVSGNYNNPVITPDGKWLVAVKFVFEEGKASYQLIRRNLRTGEEFAVRSGQNTYLNWLAYIAAHEKVLMFSTGLYRKTGAENESYLLDPETGTVQPVKGEFRPLLNEASRAPQSAGAPNTFWAVIHDRENTTRLGRYDSKNFVFTPLLEFPGLLLSNDDIWVDADGGKIWFVYQGHLLRLPLPAQTK